MDYAHHCVEPSVDLPGDIYILFMNHFHGSLVTKSINSFVQWNLVARFLVDSTQTPNMKVKMATMTYLHSLSQCMDPSDMSNSQETRMALSR